MAVPLTTLMLPDDGFAHMQVTFVSPFTKAARTHEVVDSVAVLAMAGVAAELIAFGGAEGGYTDVAQLRGILQLASPPIAAARCGRGF